jgi:tRNA U34 2-thiouridine synthase MnmA/TrmU
MAMKAVGLLSGGLDSTLAARLMLDQGIEVHAINFTSPFCTCTPRGAGCASVVTAVRQLGNIPLKHVALGDEYLEMVRVPRHGYGRGMNPCIDCRIMKVRKAAAYMDEIGASFLFTGEVLGQRPMSQHKRALEIIDHESGMLGYTVRPLSAHCLDPTVPERKGWIDRSKLLDIKGRSRKRQMDLAAGAGINDYPCSAGGCLLTDKHFADRLRDYFDHEAPPSFRDIPLLKVGRHFRLLNGDKVVVARNKHEGEALKRLSRPDDTLLVPRNFSGPVVLLRGTSLDQAVEMVCTYTKRDTGPSPELQCQRDQEISVIPIPAKHVPSFD